MNEVHSVFMAGHGTTDFIYILKQLQEKYVAKKKQWYFSFINLKKAFDQVILD